MEAVYVSRTKINSVYTHTFEANGKKMTWDYPWPLSWFFRSVPMGSIVDLIVDDAGKIIDVKMKQFGSVPIERR